MDAWTSDQLTVEAMQRGYAVTGRLITEYVQLGLLASPTRRPNGRGSDPATWEDNQAELLWVLCKQKAGGVRRNTTLTNFPVALWVHWGDEYATLQQVRRAMRTWAGSTRNKTAMRNTIKELVEDAGGKTTKIDAIPMERIEMLFDQARKIKGKGLTKTQRDELDQVLSIVGFDDNDRQATGTIIEARMLGVAPFTAVPPKDVTVFPDETMRDARMMLQATSFVTGEPFAQDVTKACVRLAAALGLHQLKDRA